MQNQATFYFHDYETFGTHPALDRPSQFAGVRTDSDLNIIEEPLVIYCKQAPDYLPNPEAVLITGITPQKTNRLGICEAEFANKIHTAFSQPNTCIIGYNNIRFDDEVSRNIFYRNFYDPYAYSWRNGNSRWDLLDVVRACYALRPEGINWPTNELDLPSFRLEHLTASNQISHQHAHDAMSDVYATIEMAKLIKQKQPKLFDYFFSLRNKKQVASLIDIINMTPLVHISGMLGAHRGNTTLIAPVAWHPTQNSAAIVCDLSGDVKQLLSLNADQIRELMYTRTEDLADDQSRIPLKLVHTNKCPIIAPAKTLNANSAERLSIDINQCEQNLVFLKQHQNEIQAKLLAVFEQVSPFEASKDVDGQIYQGFFDHHDKSICDLIQQSEPHSLSTLKISPHDERLKTLFFRYKARNYPNTLNSSEQIEWLDHCRSKVTGDKLNHYLIELETLAQSYQQQPDKFALLKELYHYCEYLTNQIAR